MAEDGTQWHESRWVIRQHDSQEPQVPSDIAANKEQRTRGKGRKTGQRGKKQTRLKSKDEAAEESKAGLRTTEPEREQMAGAVWTEVWSMQPVRSQRKKAALTALVDSANVAGWLRGTRVMGDSYGIQKQEGTAENHGNLGGFVNAPGMRALQHGMGFLDTERVERSRGQPGYQGREEGRRLLPEQQMAHGQMETGRCFFLSFDPLGPMSVQQS